MIEIDAIPELALADSSKHIALTRSKIEDLPIDA
jgi:hypothetical protein